MNTQIENIDISKGKKKENKSSINREVFCGLQESGTLHRLKLGSSELGNDNTGYM